MKEFIKLVGGGGIVSVLLSSCFPNFDTVHIFIYSLTVVCLLQLVTQLGKKLVFMEFISFSAIVFSLTVPILILDFNLDRFAVPNLFGSDILAIDEAAYFKWAIPATLALIFGLYLNAVEGIGISKNVKALEVHLGNVSKQVPLTLFIIGAISISIGPFMPGALGLVFFMLSQLTFISVLYCLFGSYSYAKWIYLGTALITLTGVASGGMFGELFWWILIIGIYLLIKQKWSYVKKIIVICLGLVCINILQIVKGEYRRLTWQNKNKSEQAGLELLGKTVIKSGQSSSEDHSLAFSFLLMYRLNHAYTVSRVMEHVPSKEPYARGETVFVSVAASFIPRFLWPDKPKSGGAENIRRFANFKPHGNTSYDIGQIGDAWANFGYYGGIVFLFLYGFFNSWILKTIIIVAERTSPTLILWIPIVFLQLLKVEVSVETNFNAAIKGVFFVYLCFRVAKKMNYSI
ncbi:MAG: hypothetical protein KC517_01710 [Bacteroidetes bacterium]|jgi:hypothetical protein|nr:hypothetical protein [Bacteroidota bacterium]